MERFNWKDAPISDVVFSMIADRRFFPNFLFLDFLFLNALDTRHE